MNNENERIVKELVQRAREAQKVAEGFSQRKVDELSAAIVYQFSRHQLAEQIAHDCVLETNMGNVESKIRKLTKKMPAVFYQIKSEKTVGVIDCDQEKGLIKIAKPVGVIAALIPSTNPEATPIFKGILALRARNAVIFAPHPGSKHTTVKVVEIMRSILENNGVTQDLFICMGNPSKELTQLLMKECDLTLATGGSDMVKAAYSSGKPAYGVGAGNAAVVIDQTADLEDAARKITIGKIGDNASGCSAENSLVIQDNIYAKMVSLLVKEGAYLASAQEKERLAEVMWVEGRLSKEIIAKPVEKIAQLAEIKVPESTKYIMVEETGIGKDYPFSGEKMSLVLTLYKFTNFAEAVEKVVNITSYSGLGHSCGIHSFDNEHILDLALNTKTTRVIVRQPHGAANSGNWFNGLANTFSLGCGTWGGNIVSENITQKHFMNTTWVAHPIEREEPSEEEIFGDLLAGIFV